LGVGRGKIVMIGGKSALNTQTKLEAFLVEFKCFLKNEPQSSKFTIFNLN